MLKNRKCVSASCNMQTLYSWSWMNVSTQKQGNLQIWGDFTTTMMILPIQEQNLHKIKITNSNLLYFVHLAL